MESNELTNKTNTVNAFIITTVSNTKNISVLSIQILNNKKSNEMNHCHTPLRITKQFRFPVSKSTKFSKIDNITL